MVLSAVLPVLHSLGVRVADERPYEVSRADGTSTSTTSACSCRPAHRELAEVRPHVENAFSAAWRGEAEVDGFNELVLRGRADLAAGGGAAGVREVPAPGRHGLLPGVHGVDLHRLPGDRRAAGGALRDAVLAPAAARRARSAPGAPRSWSTQITRQLDDVASLDQDRILRSYLTLIQATLRTSFFQRGADGRPKSYVAFKLDPQAIPDLPAPRPKYEIFVYSPRFEGVHLRFGAVARGGLRWSDRREDFRTEVLGLVKAQMVKNAVIVPVGAKGGFVLKQKPGDRDEAVACYKLFISALLDVTDNIARRQDRAAADVVRHDGDDPYLVVAADKGTATFSDIANEISVAHGFWLGDAFASGGSAGYDHKKMGITARGAWESVKRHFRDMGVDTQTAGLHRGRRRRHVRRRVRQRHAALRAHPAGGRVRPPAHLPRPRPGRRRRRIAERRRLFDLPRSSWADYDTVADLARAAASSRVPPSRSRSPPQVRAALGLGDAVTALSPGRADEGDPAGARSTCCGTAASAPTSRRRPRRTPRSATSPTTRSGSTAGSCGPRSSARAATWASPSAAGSSTRWRGGRDLHRLHRQLGRRGLLRPRGQHQDPARRRGGRRRADRGRPRRAAGRDDRRGRRAGAARQLRAGDRAGQRPVRRRTRCCRCTAG